MSAAGLAGIAVRGITSTRLAMGPRCEDPDRRGRQAEETGKRPANPASRRVVPTGAYAERTIAAYRVHAGKAIRNWSRGKPSRFLRKFIAVLPPGGRVLDYGCGIGTDLAWLRRQGFRVEGMDGALEFVQQARRRCRGRRILQGRFETVHLPDDHYDGIWCNAALIHVPPKELSRQLEKLRRALRPGGWLGLTLAWGSRKGFVRRDWIPGRYIAGYTKTEAAAFFRHWKIHSLRVVKGDGRHGRWIQILVFPVPFVG